MSYESKIHTNTHTHTLFLCLSLYIYIYIFLCLSLPLSLSPHGLQTKVCPRWISRTEAVRPSQSRRASSDVGRTSECERPVQLKTNWGSQPSHLFHHGTTGDCCICLQYNDSTHCRTLKLLPFQTTAVGAQRLIEDHQQRHRDRSKDAPRLEGGHLPSDEPVAVRPT